eukprot:CAMPEP_0201929562 /NCGR_PEP_ID=MMETSP0903-20130614/23277_1 /ASSEMBLY_ACC=CAM_ASM_000552 /TAXON_ID=420261 /ORGANISM="Thalassiosira antarctica, Strain CCMP982" /LENGTH=228 /DNA_ID=CAMNT_0048468371 /DNA_START=161 /DNA_END=847 /DNA_ORIENTATION=+
MTTHFGIYTTCLCVVILCGVPTQSFSPHAITPILGISPVHNINESLRSGHYRRTWACRMLDDDENGGTGPNGPPEFTQDEINDMDQLILSLSKESDDDKRRERLAGTLDKELADASDNPSVDDDSNESVIGAEIPRFAKLFQLSLDSIGEKVQTDARAKALEQQQQNLNNGDDADDTKIESEGGDIIPERRVKSPEELQLWALIDMMIQSKTRVKLHMGSLGSKGEFR